MGPTIYDQAYPSSAADVSTPARAAAVKEEDAIRNDRLETGIFIARDGREVIRKTGAPNQVRFMGTDLFGTQGALFTHNHPGNGTFSLQDVMAAIDSNACELRAVGPTLRYVMRPCESGWPTEQMLIAAVASAAPIAQNRVSWMIARRQVELQFAQAETEHQLWVEVAGALGLEYTREKS